MMCTESLLAGVLAMKKVSKALDWEAEKVG